MSEFVIIVTSLSAEMEAKLQKTLAGSPTE